MRHYDDSNALLVTKMKDEMSGFTIEELVGSKQDFCSLNSIDQFK